MTLDINNPMYKCLQRYLLELEMEALQAFKTMLLAYRGYLEMYIQLLALASVNFELENFILNLKLAAQEALLQSTNNTISGIMKQMIPGELAECLGAGDIMAKLQGGVKKMTAGLVGSTGVGSSGKSDLRVRFEISNKISKAISDDLQKTVDDVDMLIGFVDEAINSKVKVTP